MAFHVTAEGHVSHRGIRSRGEQCQPSTRKQTFSLYPTQYEFVQDAHGYVLFCAGRGAGKSMAGCIRDLLYAMENPGSRLLVCAPTYTMLRDNTRQTFLDICPREYIVRYSQKENTVNLRNGSLVYFRSLDQPNLVRGYTVAAVHMDEAGYVSKEGWDIVKATVRQPGYPHQRWLTTTPRGKNWIWEEWEMRPSPDHVMYRARSKDNPHLPKDFEESLGYTGAFHKQEVLGLFESFEGLVFRTFSRDLVVPPITDLTQFRRVVCGVDFGFNDSAVCLIVGERHDKSLVILDEWYEKGMTIEDHIRAAQRLRHQWNYSMICADPSRPDSIEMFRRAGLPIQKGNNDIESGLVKIASYLPSEQFGASRLTVSSLCKNTIMEFESYSFKTDSQGVVTGEKPQEGFDHAMDSARYAILYLAKAARRDIWY